MTNSSYKLQFKIIYNCVLRVKKRITAYASENQSNNCTYICKSPNFQRYTFSVEFRK